MKLDFFSKTQNTGFNEFFEIEKKIKIPDSYKLFLKNYDSVEYTGTLKFSNSILGKLNLRKIYNFDEFDKYFDYVFSDEAKEYGFFTIGETLAPISICMGLYDNEYYGKVYLFGWDDGLIFQAQDFDSFIESLELEDNSFT